MKENDEQTFNDNYLKTHFPTINLLRGIAALFVCLYHFIGYKDFRGELFSFESNTQFIGNFGTNGVFMFFVISGFVIPFSLFKYNFKLTSFHRFLVRRFIRIEIPYIISIMSILSLGFLFSIIIKFNYEINFMQFLYHLIYIIPFSDFEWYNPIYWTLAIEFQFYILIGLLYFFLISENKKLIFVALLLFGLSSFFINDKRFVFYYSTIFLQGIILFLIETKKIKSHTGIILIGICVIATAYQNSIEVSIFSALTVISIYTLEINTKLTNRIGDISYSLYLNHGLIGGNILYLFSRFITSFSGKTTLVFCAIVASLLFSYVFWLLIDRPSRYLSSKIKLNK